MMMDDIQWPIHECIVSLAEYCHMNEKLKCLTLGFGTLYMLFLVVINTGRVQPEKDNFVISLNIHTYQMVAVFCPSVCKMHVKQLNNFPH